MYLYSDTALSADGVITELWSGAEVSPSYIIMGYIGSYYRRLYLAVCQGLSREVRTYAGTCQLDECRIMRPVARDCVHLTARCTGVSSPGIMYICTRSLVLMLLASGRCTVRTYEYYWGLYPAPVVLCTVVLLYLNSAERAHMYPDTCTPKRTPVTLNVIGVEMLKIISDCQIGYECGKILSEKTRST
jgi:hypothetical protein